MGDQFRRRLPPQGPVPEPALGQALVAKPEALPVVDKEFDGLTAATAEHEHSSREGITSECLPAEADQSVDPPTEVHRFNRHQYPHLRGYLDQPRLPRNAATMPAVSMPRPRSRLIRIREPSGEEISMVVPGGGVGALSPASVTGSSTKAASTNPGFSRALVTRVRRAL